MKIMILLLTTLLLMACKTKKVVSDFESQKELTEVKSLKDSISNVSKVQEKQVISKKETTEKQQENQTEIEVKGKAEIDKPLELYNVENGDTIQFIKVTGNAEVHLRSKINNSNQVKKENTISSLTNKVEEISRNLVKEKNLKKTGKQINTTAKKTVTRTGTFWSFGLVAVALVLLAIFIYFKKYKK